MTTNRFPFNSSILWTSPALGALVLFACGPRHPTQTANNANTQSTTAAATATAQPTATTQPTTYAQPTTTQTAAPTTAATSTTTTTVAPTVPPVIVIPPTTAAWPPAAIPIDPNLVQTWIKKAAELGIPIPGGTTPTAPPVASDPIDATIRANAATQAPGFSPSGPIARAKGLKINEHAGMNFSAAGGKCYVVFAASSGSITQIALRVFFPAAPPNAVVAEDKGSSPVLGTATKLCPPVAAQFRIDSEVAGGSGDLGVQVWEK
jgi:hypothetical protein